MSNPETLPAIPPADYVGSQADWMVRLQQWGFWDGEGWYGDVEVPVKAWWEILEDCEGDDHFTLNEKGEKNE